MDDVTLITLILSIWGACLSTILAVDKLLGNRQKLKTSISMVVIPAYPKPRVGLGIGGVNVGKRPVTLNSHYIDIVNGIPDKERLYPMGVTIVTRAPELPCKLEDGDAFSLIVDGETLADSITENGYSGEIKIIGVLKEASGKEFKSKPLKISVDLLRNK